MNIEHNLKLNVTPDVVYNAVSTQKGIQGWWCQNSKVGETIGSRTLLSFVKEGMEIDMGFETVLLEPNKKVVWQCISMPNPAWIGTRLITEIVESPEGCEVSFKHADFDREWEGKPPFEQTKSTWNHFVQSLANYCENGVGQPW